MTIIMCSFCKEIALVHCRKARQLLLHVSGRKGLAQKLGTFDVVISDCIITRFCVLMQGSCYLRVSDRTELALK